MDCPPEETTESRAYHHGNLREAILSAALDRLRSEEPSAISLRELARTAGVRHSALYVHFRDRSALLASIAGQGFRALLQKLRATLADQSNGLDVLAATYIKFARDNPAYYRTMFLPEVSRPENYAQLQEACEGCFKALVEGLTTTTSSSAETHERAVAIWSTLHGLALLGDDSGPLHRQISPEQELGFAGKIVRVLSGTPWPDDRFLPTRPWSDGG